MGVVTLWWNICKRSHSTAMGLSWKSGRNTLAADHSQAREHLFEYCSQWKAQQKILWAEVRRETVIEPPRDARAPIAEREGFCRSKRARISQFGWRFRLPGRFGCSLASRFAVRNRAISVALRRLNRIFPRSVSVCP